MSDSSTASETADPSVSVPLRALRWRFVGPYRGGRVMAVAGHPTDRRTFYHGTSSGGVWRTEDGGATWSNVSDGFFTRASVGALAISEAAPSVIYVGMGECGLRSNVTHGDGVWRSVDDGATWQQMGLAETQNIARIRIHPTNPDLVYVAAFGHRFGPNAERGIYRSRDGGVTWARVLHLGPDIGAIDLALDPLNPRVLYAAMWQARIYPWAHATAGPGGGLYKSTDGGDTWAELSGNPGFPEGPRGRIGVTASPGKRGRVWAIVDAEEGGIYRSDDGGQHWTWLSDDRNFRVRPWYFGKVVADPGDSDGVYVVNRKLWRSGDGGRSYRQVNVPYVDEMDLWVDPRDPTRMALGNDGGAAVSFDCGDTWSPITNQPTAEIYKVAADTHFPYRIYGSQQDNSTLCLPSRSERGPISEMDWYDVGGGESGFIAVRPDNPNIVYSSDLPGLGVTRYDHATRQFREIGPWGEPGDCDEGAPRFRFNWSTPVVLSPHDPDTLYIAGNVLFRSYDEGASWQIVSPDLTRNDREKIEGQPPGSHAVGENEGNHYCTISAVAESPHTRGIIWVGSDDGLIHVSTDAAASWRNVTPPGLPMWSLTNVEPSPHDPGAAYVTASAHVVDDFAPYVYRTRDSGETWARIVAGIPEAEFVRVIRADPEQPGVLYCGTEAGVYVSLDDGESWQPLRLNLPVVAIHDLVVKDADLVIGTHGRGLWILDDVTPLRELSRGGITEKAHLFPPRPVYRLTRQIYGLDSLIALYQTFAAENPPSGAVIYYFLAEEASEASVTLIDGEGVVVNHFHSRHEPSRPAPIGPLAYQLQYGAATLTGTVTGEREPGVTWGAQTLDRGGDALRLPTEPGLHRITLGITYPGARRVPGAASRGITAPVAKPGSYTVRLTVDSQSWERPLEIRPDPRLSVTNEEYAAQFDLMIRIRDKVSEIHDAVNLARDLEGQLAALHRHLCPRPAWSALAEQTARLRGALTEVERAMIQPNLHERSGELASVHFPVRLNNKLEALGYHVARSDNAPTAQDEALYADLAARADRELARFGELVDGEVTALNAALRAGEVPAVIVNAPWV